MLRGQFFVKAFTFVFPGDGPFPLFPLQSFVIALFINIVCLFLHLVSTELRLHSNRFYYRLMGN